MKRSSKRPLANASGSAAPLAPVSRVEVIVYTVAAIFALVGLADATYLTVQFLSGETAVCGGSPDCYRVLGSSYARIGNLPVAIFGVLGYFAVFAFAIFVAFGYRRCRKFFVWLVWMMFAVTLWFLYVQAFILHAFCRYCLVSAATVFLLAGLAAATRPAEY